MTSLQLATWDGVRRGDIDAISSRANLAIADAALARVMLCRRRAVTATVLDEFYADVGAGFRSRDAQHLDRTHELAEALTAAVVVARYAGPVGALMYERAVIARMEGRIADALRDWRAVLSERPAFVAAAIETARLSLAAGEPSAAVLALAPVEQEIREVRLGGGILADALRAMGKSLAAMRYDLTSLLASGHRDGRGNTCPPDDVCGQPVVDKNMPPAFVVMHLPDGRFLMNDRGHYFLAPHPLNQLPLALLLLSVRSDGAYPKRREKPVFADLRERFTSMAGRMHVNAREHAPPQVVRHVRGLIRLCYSLRRKVGSTRAHAQGRLYRHARGPARAAARPLWHAYKALPEPIRALGHRFALPHLLRWSGVVQHEFRLFSVKEGLRIAQQIGRTTRHRLAAAPSGVEVLDGVDHASWSDLRLAEGLARIIGEQALTEERQVADRHPD